MKKLLVLLILLLTPIVVSADDWNSDMSVEIIVPVVLFISGAFIAIFVTKAIVDANAKVKQAKYEMMKKFAETGNTLPKEFAAEIKDDADAVKAYEIYKKDVGFLKTLGWIGAVLATLFFLTINSFKGDDLVRFIIGLMFGVASSYSFVFYYKGLQRLSQSKHSSSKNEKDGENESSSEQNQ